MPPFKREPLQKTCTYLLAIGYSANRHWNNHHFGVYGFQGLGFGVKGFSGLRVQACAF